MTTYETLSAPAVEYSIPAVQPGVCPHCGYCPHCGRGNAPGYVAQYFSTPTNPYFNPYPTITSSVGSIS